MVRELGSKRRKFLRPYREIGKKNPTVSVKPELDLQMSKGQYRGKSLRHFVEVDPVTTDSKEEIHQKMNNTSAPVINGRL